MVIKSAFLRLSVDFARMTVLRECYLTDVWILFLFSMKKIFSYVCDYAATVDRRLFCFCTIWIGFLIALNYRFDLEQAVIAGMDSRWHQFLALFVVYCSAFVVPYGFVIRSGRYSAVSSPLFWFLLLLAPAIFALKVSVANPLEIVLQGGWGSYWVIVTTLPFKLLVVLMPLVVLYHMLPGQQGFWGMTVKLTSWRPYLSMLLMMMPLVAFASTQPDFLNSYPRLKQIAFLQSQTDYFLFYQLLYEIGYGIDFVTIELFFRGFLVFAFARYVGASAILPMAAFYCSIHFGKPLLECISSFWGGLILGVIAYRTQTIVGGLAVHLGIAWMMEIGGYAGNIAMR